MIAYMLLPVLATQLGGLVVIVRSPSADVRGGIQHFAAGVIFVVRDTLGVGEVTLIFALGVVAMLLVRRLGPEPTPASPQQRFLPLGLLWVALDWALALLLGQRLGGSWPLP
jgi:hypothetical protein